MINKALPLGLALAAGFGVIGFFSDAVAQDSFPTFQCDLSDTPPGIGIDPDAAVTVSMTETEREVLNLAIPGYIADLQGELAGAADAGFQNRAFGLGIFAFTTVPCIRDKVNDPALIDAADGSIPSIDFNSFERVAIQIMMQIWNPRDGVMAHHIRGCRRSQELRNAQEFGDPEFPNLCATVFPLADSAASLFRKVSRDQRERGS